MSKVSNPLEEIKKHQAAIEALKNEAVTALKAKRAELQGQIAEVDKEIEELTGKASASKPARKSGAAGNGPKPKTKEELITLIQEDARNGEKFKVRSDALENAKKLIGDDKSFTLTKAAKGPWTQVSYGKK